MRQIGFGDMVVGKQVGRMMSALGGRLGAYRAADGTAELREALIRTLWRGNAPAEAGLAHVMGEVAALRAAHAATPDRKSVGVGQSVAVRVDPGDGPIFKNIIKY